MSLKLSDNRRKRPKERKKGPKSCLCVFGGYQRIDWTNITIGSCWFECLLHLLLFKYCSAFAPPHLSLLSLTCLLSIYMLINLPARSAQCLLPYWSLLGQQFAPIPGPLLLTNGHSECLTISTSFQPFTHTFTNHQGFQTRKATPAWSWAERVRCLAQGHTLGHLAG